MDGYGYGCWRGSLEGVCVGEMSSGKGIAADVYG